MNTECPRQTTTIGSLTSRSDRALSGTLTSVLQYVALMGMQVVLTPLVLWTSGQEALGAYSILLQLVAFVSLVDLGFGVTLNRYLAQSASVEGRLDSRFDAVFSIGRTFYLLSNAVAATILIVIALAALPLLDLSPEVRSEFRISLALLATWYLLKTPLAVFGAALTATQNQSAANLSAIVGNIVRLVVAMTLLFSGLGLTGLVIAIVAAEAITYSLQRRIFRKQFARVELRWGLSNRSLAREMFGFGGYTFLLTLGNRLSFNADSIVVGSLFGAAAASVYYSTQMPAFVAFTIIYRLAASAEPAVNELMARKDAVALRRAYLRIQRFTLLAAVAMASALLFLGEHTISLWLGPDQFAGVIMIVSLSIFIVLITSSNVDYVYMVAQGKISVLSRVVVVEGVSNVALSVVLARAIGLQGVMVSTLIVMVPRMMYQSAKIRQLLGIPLRFYILKVILPLAGPVAAGGISLLAFSVVVEAYSVWTVAGSLAVFVVGYSFTAYAAYLTADERGMLSNLAGRIVPRRVEMKGS